MLLKINLKNGRPTAARFLYAICSNLNDNLAVTEYKSGITFISGLTPQNDTRCSLKRCGKLVVFNARLVFATADTQTAEFQIATLPNSCAPASEIFAACNIVNSSFKTRFGTLYIAGLNVKFTPNLVIANDVDTKYIGISMAWYVA